MVVTPKEIVPPPVDGEVRQVALNLTKLRESHAALLARLEHRVEELARAHSQYYRRWQKDPSGLVYSSTFRFRPEGTDEEQTSVCLYFPSDSNYIYFCTRYQYVSLVCGTRVLYGWGEELGPV